MDNLIEFDVPFIYESKNEAEQELQSVEFFVGEALGKAGWGCRVRYY